MLCAYAPVIANDTTAGAKVETGEVSIVPGKNNYDVVFGDPIQSNKMTYNDGKAKGITDSSDPTWSEDFEMDGIKGRKVYGANHVYLNLDTTKFDPEKDHRFMVLLTYYDFGPDVGKYYFDYPSTKGGSNRVTITKPGITPKWSTESFIISDADFTTTLASGSHVDVVTGAYNAFAKIELINIADIENSEDSLDIPTVNNIQAEALSILDLYDAEDASGNPYGLEQTMTRAEVLKAIVKATGHESEIANAAPSTSFTDISGETAKVVAVAEKYGLVKGSYGKFYPDRNATVRETLTFAMRYIGYESPTLYDEAYDLAFSNGIIIATDFVIFIDRAVIRDNLVAILYNMLSAPNGNPESDDLLVVELMEKDIVTPEGLKATGNPKLTAYEYYIPRPCPKTLIQDSVTGWNYWYVNFNGKKMIRPYVTQQGWNYDGTKFVFGNDGTGAMYEYDVVNETVKFLDHTPNDGSYLNAIVTPDDKIIYTNGSSETWMMDWKTYKKKYLSSTWYGTMAATNDGKWLSGYGGSSNMLYRTNTETGETDTLEIPKDILDRWKTYPVSAGKGHPMINPVYPELYFFCHEGTTTGIPDRLMLGNFDTSEVYNMFVQAGPENSPETRETSGHEVWSMDGTMMYWVKYTYTSNLGQSGLMRTDKYGKTREYINGDFAHWHCYPSSDHNWVAGDTNLGQIALVNTNTYESWYIAKFNMFSHTHPYQPHPHINYGNTMVSWQMVDSSNMLGVGFADISHLTANPRKNERLPLDDKITLIVNEQSDYMAYETEFDGERCFEVKQDNKIFIDVNDDYMFEDDASIKLEVTYLDYGKQPIQLKYTQVDPDDRMTLANRENVVLNAPEKADVKQWKTAVFDVKGASLTNRGQHQSDFMLHSPLSQMLIKNIRVIEE